MRFAVITIPIWKLFGVWDQMYVAIDMIVDTNSRAENVYVTK